MKQLALASALAVSLFSITSATAERSVDRLDRLQSGTMHKGTPNGALEACNDQADGLAFLSCGVPKRSAAERPTWRGLY